MKQRFGPRQCEGFGKGERTSAEMKADVGKADVTSITVEHHG